MSDEYSQPPSQAEVDESVYSQTMETPETAGIGET